ncbi:MAG: alpha/beta hydrolase [Ramlibacter sp.]|nr:alpha/beta hydrolase [Ramlibacter sp.]
MPYAESGAGKLYYEETGEGEPIIFCHEFAADYRTWEPQVRYFSRHYRCITYNSLGYSPSDVPDDDAAYGYEQQRDNIRALMDHLGIEKAHLVGLSMGSYSALQFALAYPDRVTAVAFSSGGSASLPLDRKPDPTESLKRGHGLLEVGWDAAIEFASLGPTRVQLQNKDARGWAQFREYLLEHPAKGSGKTMLNFQAQRPTLYGREADLRKLKTPVLLMVGDEDDGVIEVNIFLKRTIPRAGMWMAPRTGHAMNLEEPAMYNQMLAEFFSAVERGGWGPRDPRATPHPA